MDSSKPSGAPLRYLDYLLDPTELWARSYTQYIGRQNGDELLERQLNNNSTAPRARLILASQWDDQDSVKISRVIEGLLRVLGWMNQISAFERSRNSI